MKKLSHTLPAILFACLPLLFSGVSHAAEKGAVELDAAWQAVREGRALVMMRHAIAPGFGDPSEFELGDCATQRNLSEEGRLQAKSIGDTLRLNGINEATVLTSQWCRCQETAQLLGLGVPEAAPVLNSFFQGRGSRTEQTQSLNESIRRWLPEDDEVRVLVTHQVNISALTGQFASSGTMLIITLNNEELTVLASVDTP